MIVGLLVAGGISSGLFYFWLMASLPALLATGPTAVDVAEPEGPPPVA